LRGQSVVEVWFIGGALLCDVVVEAMKAKLHLFLGTLVVFTKQAAKILEVIVRPVVVLFPIVRGADMPDWMYTLIP
jgi:hypothetical protein